MQKEYLFPNGHTNHAQKVHGKDAAGKEKDLEERETRLRVREEELAAQEVKMSARDSSTRESTVSGASVRATTAQESRGTAIPLKESGGCPATKYATKCI